MDILSALDAEFLYLEDDTAPLHIGGVCTFEGPPPSHDELLAALEAKLDRIPRYRQVVAPVPFELGRPIWVDDPHFDLRFHVLHTALPAPGDDAALTRLVGRLMSHRLDRDRPLWEIWQVEGLEGGRWALVCKVHHAMVDGIAGVGLLSVILDLDPDAPVPEPVPWTPAPAPSNLARVAGAWRTAAGDAARLVGEVPAMVTHPVDTVRGAGQAVRGLLGFGRHVLPTPESSLEGSIGPHRVYAHATVALDDIKAIRRAFGGTVNDVVLAALSEGYRRLLVAHGDDPHHAVVTTGVPVSVRRDDGAGVPDNRVSTLLVELPVHLGDLLSQLAAVRTSVAEARRTHMSEVGEAVTHLADLAPPMALGLVSRLAVEAERHLTQRSVTTVTTNVPGPQFPLYCLGRRMLEYLPYVPIAAGVRVGTAILSYDGQVAFGITGDAGTVPDVDVLARATAEAIEELACLAQAEGHPRPHSHQADGSADRGSEEVSAP